MDLTGGLNEILQMGACEEVPQVYEFAVVLILDVDDAPLVLSASDLLAIDDDRLLTADNRERNDVLDSRIGGTFFVIQLLIVIRVHLEVVEGKLLLDSLLKRSAFLEGEGIGLCDDWHHVDDVGELFQDHNINGLQSVTGWLNKE